MDNGKQILQLITEMNEKMQSGFEAVHSEIKVIKSDMNDMRSDINTLKYDANEMNSKMENGFKEVHSEIKIMKSDIKDLKTTLENETNKNIRIIAEGHIDLSNKLDKALKIENEKEVLLIRLTILENEVNIIKTRLNEIA